MTAAVAVALPMALLRVLTYQDAADPAGYVRMAGRSAGLLNAASPGGLYTLQPPIYPLTVTLYQTLGASTIDQHRVGGIALGLVLVLATIALSQRLFGTRITLTAGVISAISINMVNGDLNLYPETLASIWLVLSVLCVVGWLDSRKWWWAVAAGFVGGLAALTRGELVALIPLSIAVVLAASRGELGRGGFKSRAQALMPAAAVAAAAISVMAPWWATTAYLTDSPTLTATGARVTSPTVHVQTRSTVTTSPTQASTACSPAPLISPLTNWRQPGSLRRTRSRSTLREQSSSRTICRPFPP